MHAQKFGEVRPCGGFRADRQTDILIAILRNEIFQFPIFLNKKSGPVMRPVFKLSCTVFLHAPVGVKTRVIMPAKSDVVIRPNRGGYRGGMRGMHPPTSI